MTELLQEALRRVSSLPSHEQDAIAAQILEALQDEEEWRRISATVPPHINNLADEALEEHRRGKTRPLDELIR